MNMDDPAPIVLQRKTTDFIYYQTRFSVQIELGDWDRWMRLISKIPKHDFWIRDTAFVLLGIAFSLFYNVTLAIINGVNVPRIDLIFGILLVGMFLICLFFERRIVKIVSSQVDQLLQDMKEVYERADRSEKHPHNKK